MWGRFPFAIIAEPKLLTYKKNRKTENSSLKFSLETMEGTTGQKRRPKQTPKNIQTLDRAAAHARIKPSLNSFQSKRCTRIWHDKQRENGAIPIWNFNEHTFAADSGSQWSRFSWTPSVRSKEKHRRAALTFPQKHNLPVWIRALSSFIVILSYS